MRPVPIESYPDCGETINDSEQCFCGKDCEALDILWRCICGSVHDDEKEADECCRNEEPDGFKDQQDYLNYRFEGLIKRG